MGKQMRGYGFVGNIAKTIILNEILDKEHAEQYRQQLQQESPEQYEEYLQYEKNRKW